MSEYIITDKQIEELNKAHGGMQILTSWLSAYAIFDTSEFPPLMKSEHLAITLPNVVRCKDCEFGENDGTECMRPDGDGDYLRMPVKPDGFCAWGEQRGDWITCKCGQEIEAPCGWVVCPSCGRRWMNER